MSALAELARELERCRADAEFPAWLLPAIAAVAEHPERSVGREELVARLLDQMRRFDPYAGAGCFADTASLADIEQTLALLGD